MNNEELKNLLIEHGVPENQVEEMIGKFNLETDEIKRQHAEGTNDTIEISPGLYLSHLLSQETDWRKRAVIAAKIASLNLGT